MDDKKSKMIGINVKENIKTVKSTVDILYSDSSASNSDVYAISSKTIDELDGNISVRPSNANIQQSAPDCCIIFAKNFEHEAFLNVLKANNIQYVSLENINELDIREFTLPNSIIKIFAICMRDQGPVDAAALASALIIKYNPRSLFTIGVMGGVSLPLNTVALVNTVLPLDDGRVSIDGEYKRDSSRLQCDAFAVKDFISNFKLHDIQIQPFQEESFILSSVSVRNDLGKLKETYSNALGVDMESWGIIRAHDYLKKLNILQEKQLTVFPICKAVSDIAGDSDNGRKEKRIEAARRAAIVGLEYLKYRLVKNKN